MAARLDVALVLCAVLCGCAGRDAQVTDEFDPLYLADGPSALVVRVSIERIEYLPRDAAGIEQIWSLAVAPDGPALPLWAANGLRMGVIGARDVVSLKEKLKAVPGLAIGRSEVSMPAFNVTMAKRAGTSVLSCATVDETRAFDVDELHVYVGLALLGSTDDARLTVAPAWSEGRGPVNAMEALSITVPAAEDSVYVVGPAASPPEMSLGWVLSRCAGRDGTAALALVRVKFKR